MLTTYIPAINYVGVALKRVPLSELTEWFPYQVSDQLMTSCREVPYRPPTGEAKPPTLHKLGKTQPMLWGEVHTWL